MDYKRAWYKLKDTIEEVEKEGGKSDEWVNVISIKDLKMAMEIIEREENKTIYKIQMPKESEVSNND